MIPSDERVVQKVVDEFLKLLRAQGGGGALGTGRARAVPSKRLGTRPRAVSAASGEAQVVRDVFVEEVMVVSHCESQAASMASRVPGASAQERLDGWPSRSRDAGGRPWCVERRLELLADVPPSHARSRPAPGGGQAHFTKLWHRPVDRSPSRLLLFLRVPRRHYAAAFAPPEQCAQHKSPEARPRRGGTSIGPLGTRGGLAPVVTPSG